MSARYEANMVRRLAARRKPVRGSRWDNLPEKNVYGADSVTELFGERSMERWDGWQGNPVVMGFRPNGERVR